MKLYRSICLTALVLCLCVCGLLATPVSAADGDNIASNGDLELGLNNWDVQYGNAVIATDVVHSGNNSLKLTATGAYSPAVYKRIPVRKNADVTVSVWFNYGTTSGTRQYYIFAYKGDNPDAAGTTTYANQSLTPSSWNTAWKKVTFTFNSGNYDCFTLKFSPGGAGSQPCYIDDLVVTSVGGDETPMDPYLTSFGTKSNRPSSSSYNLINNGGFESATNAQWDTASFIDGNLSVVEDPTAPEGDKSLYFNAGSATYAARHSFSVAVEKYTQYTFSAWVKSPRLSATNRATATFGVADPDSGEFLVYEPYNGNGHGVASLSTPAMQLMATSPDGEWHLRSVTFYSGSAATVNITVYGAASQLYLDDMALFKSAYGIEYVSALRTETITAWWNDGNKYCANADSLIPDPHLSGTIAQEHWSSNPAWRNGWFAFEEGDEEHGTVLHFYSSLDNRQLAYIDWIEVQPYTDYTFTIDLRRFGGAPDSCIALLDDNINSPKEFYTISLEEWDNEWMTHSVTFNTGMYSRIGFAVINQGGDAMMDKIRLFRTEDGIPDEPGDGATPLLKPTGGLTAVMEMDGGPLVKNGDFESGAFYGFDVYQGTVLSADAAYNSAWGAHLKGDGSWGAMLEQLAIPVLEGREYTLSYWYKANSSGANITLKGADTGVQYAYMWADKGQWTLVTATFTVMEDTTVILNICGGGNGKAEDLYLDEISLVTDGPTSPLGVAFMMQLDVTGARREEQYVGDLSHATVDVYRNGQSYKLVKMGALMTNDSVVGCDPSTLVMDAINEVSVIDIPAVYLYEATEDSASYAVRIIHIPAKHADALIYARPYYVFEQDGEEIVVYGSIYSRSYNSANGTSPFNE